VERFIGTVKRELRQEMLTDSHEFDRRLARIRQWYNHDGPTIIYKGGHQRKSGLGSMCL
jgi:hypothetical protein